MSKRKRQYAGGLFDRPGRLLAGSAVLVYILWNLFTFSTSWQERLVGAVATAATILFLTSVLRTAELKLDFRLRDIALFWRLPWDILKDCWVVTVVLAKDLAGVEKAEAFYGSSAFKTSRHDAVLIGRSALAVAYATMSPNMIVIGVDSARSLIVFHQVKRSEVPVLVRRLGGQV